MTAANTHTARPHKMIKIPSNDIVSRELVIKSMWNVKSQTG